MAGDVRVPPAPWVKVSKGSKGALGVALGEDGLLESMQSMGLGWKGMEKFWAAMLLNLFFVFRCFNVGCVEYVCSLINPVMIWGQNWCGLKP